MSDLGNKEIFSRNLKKYIEESGKDRRWLAEKWGFPYSTVSEWVNGKKYPRIDRIETIAEYFGILKSDLIEDKLTPEDEKDNDTMADIIVHMQMDHEFLSLVDSLHRLDSEKRKAVKAMLDVLAK